ncbi:hypothetical protein D3P00_17455 [Escherichia coli]|uniref:Uncharacterized protein n=1 Tax=Salmonella enterica TaxID=28901 RepID=A0A5T4LAB6_SALER|nr:hypothetical protein [Salmonella enterica]ECB7542195.1 hypothetical protein [Salmonella enterica subsp. enterica serovar Schwarzengrund]EFV6292406.1 hypothetical protein [Shigella flexneri]KAB2560605.1 hypothetical protein D3P00_17455 [Escherichia coli]EBL7481758.1 hypothetical protein [Salmonella enterica]
MCEPCVKGVSTVKTRGMLFNDEMVRAILADQKTQTRRIIKPQYSSDAARRFYRLTQSMHTLLGEVREHFPDAMFYSANGKVSLLLGSSHNKHDQPMQEMVAVSATQLHIEGGDW